MSTTETTMSESAQPISSAMPEGARACGRCGIPVAPGEDHGDVVADPGGQRTIVRGGDVLRVGADRSPVLFATCQTCADREREAGRIMRAHPALAERIGPTVARDRLASALDAFAAVGAAIPYEEMTGDAMLTRFILDTMSVPGAAAQWVSAYRVGEVTDDQCAGVPFAGATPEVRAVVRQRVGAVLAYRVATSAPPVELRAPDRKPCMFFGLDTVSMPAHRVVALGGSDAAQAAAWTPRTGTLNTLGRPGRRQIAGHLCPPCSRAADHAGALGVAAMSRALADHLRATGQTEAARSLDYAVRAESVTGLIGHAALGIRANRTAWAHVRLGDGLAPFTSGGDR